MTEIAQTELSDRDRRDQAAGSVLDWLAYEETGGPQPYLPPMKAFRLLAEHAQRESVLDRMVAVIETAREFGDVSGPLVTLADALDTAERFDGSAIPHLDDCLTASATIKLLAAELVAQDRRRFAQDAIIARLPEQTKVMIEAAALFREYQRHHEARTRQSREDARSSEDSRHAELCHENANESERKADRNRQIADKVETVLYGGPAGGSMADASDWRAHLGGPCPVEDPAQQVEIKLRGGEFTKMRAEAIHWGRGTYLPDQGGNLPVDCEVVAWRPVQGGSTAGSGGV